MKIGFVLQKGNGIMHITQNAFNINNLDTDERLGCGKMKEDGKNSWLARNRGGGKVGKGREGSLTDSLSNTETKLHRLTESQKSFPN